ncbi:hypothetical protein [uncultured Clostridium sp.]|uniref:hypothetical protein n=1 Tax=uncultured Clostridium sp. TaxID=59620 RepID=UPI0026F27EF7|nr:hypothetical protein [uncultured Clostridium sp.]
MENITTRYPITDAHNLIGNFITDILNIYGYYDRNEQCIPYTDYISLQEDIEHKRKLSHNEVVSILSSFNGMTINEIITASIVINKDIYVDTYNELISEPEEFDDRINRLIPCKNKSNGKSKSEAFDILVKYSLGKDRKVEFTTMVDLSNNKDELGLADILDNDNIEPKYEKFIYAFSFIYPKLMQNNVLYLDIEKLSDVSGLSLKEVSFFIKLLAQPQFNTWRLLKSTLNRKNMGSVQAVLLCDNIEIPMINGYDDFKGFTYSVSYKLKTTKNICVENKEYMKHIGKRCNIILPTIFETNQNMIPLPDGSFGVLNEKIFTGLEQSYNSVFSRRLFNLMSIIDVVGNLNFKNNIRGKKKINPKFKLDRVDDPHYERLSKIVHYSDLTEYEAGEVVREKIVVDGDGYEHIQKEKEIVYTDSNVISSRALDMVQQLSKKGINTDGRDFSFRDQYGTKHKVYWDRKDMTFTVGDLRNRINYLYETNQMTQIDYNNNIYNYNAMIKSITSCFYIKGSKKNSRCEKYAENYVDKWYFKCFEDCNDITFSDLLSMPLKTALALEMSYSFIERCQIVHNREVSRDIKSFAINVLNPLKKLNIEEMENKDLYLKNRILEHIRNQCIDKGYMPNQLLEEMKKYNKESDPETILYSYFSNNDLWDSACKISSILNEFIGDYNTLKMEYKQKLDMLKQFKYLDRLTLKEKSKIYQITEEYNKITGKDLEIKSFKMRATEILKGTIEQNKYVCNRLKNCKKEVNKQERKEVISIIKSIKRITKLSKSLNKSLNKSKKLTEYTNCEINKQDIKIETVCTELFNLVIELEDRKDNLVKYNVNINYLEELKSYLLNILNRKYEIKQGTDYTINKLCNLDMVYNQFASA